MGSLYHIIYIYLFDAWLGSSKGQLGIFIGWKDQRNISFHTTFFMFWGRVGLFPYLKSAYMI